MKIVRLPKECFVEMLKDAGFSGFSADLLNGIADVSTSPHDRERLAHILAKFGELKIERLEKEGIVLDHGHPRQPFDAWRDGDTYVFMQGDPPV